MNTDPVEEGQGTPPSSHRPDPVGAAEPVRRWALL
jgi:hypothetical protein